MVYKPQFGILFPLVLAATGRWRSFAAAAATVALLSADHDPRLRRLGMGGVPRLRPVSPAGRARSRAIPAGTKSRASLRGRGCGAGRFRSPMRCKARCRLRSPSRSTGCGAARRPIRSRRRHFASAPSSSTPYSFDYDMMVLAPAIAFLAVDGIRSRLRRLGKNGAGGAMARPARRAQRRPADADPARSSRDARGIRSDIAPQQS